MAGNALASGGGLWRQVGFLRGHCDDVLDLAWAPDGSALLSGGVENNCILWDVEGRKSLVGTHACAKGKGDKLCALP